jgi:hypothetical protein
MPLTKRIVAVILSVLTVFSCVSAFAAEETDHYTITSTSADHSADEDNTLAQTQASDTEQIYVEAPKEASPASTI